MAQHERHKMECQNSKTWNTKSGTANPETTKLISKTT